jgi:hypothetical protein
MMPEWAGGILSLVMIYVTGENSVAIDSMLLLTRNTHIVIAVLL